MKRYLGIPLVAVLLVAPAAWAQVNRPNPSPTPQGDSTNTGMVGLPRPSAAPSCISGDAGLYADRKGCIYACSAGARTIVAGVVCALPTTAATATPVTSPSPTPNI